MKGNLYYYQFILAVLLIAYSSGSLQAQNILDSRVSIKEPSTTVRKLLKNIERKLPVNFGYSNESIPGNPAVHLEAGNFTLREIIQSVCDQLYLTYDLVGNFVVFNIKENVEEKISGVVSNEKGEPLAGATISAGRDETMTATDENGAFTLTVKRGVRELRVTSVGYHPLAVRLKGEKHLTLSLTVNETGMDDVLVVGYGTQKKSNIAGAVSVVRPSDIENHQIARAENALQGRVAGVAAMAISGAPGSNSNIRIRGNTSFNAAANDPLYVVDGVVVGSNNIEMIAPGEIASIEILKDAASASIYGARSSAGVVLITTKKGAEGNYIVNYNTYLGFQKPAKKLRLLNATEYATLRNEQSVNGGGGIIFEKPEQLGKGTDWQELLFNNRAFIQNHNINISGGRNGSSFFGSVGYMNEDGVVATDISNFKRYNIRINSKHKITEKVTFGESIGYAHVKTLVGVAANTNFLSPLTSAVNLDPITPALVTDPDMINEPPYSNQPVVKNGQGLFYGVSDIVTQQMANPLAYIKTRLGNYNWSDNIVGNAFIELDTKTGIKARSVAGVDLRYWGTEAFLPVFYLNPTLENAQTSFTRTRNKQANWNVENTLSFEKNHKGHHVIALLGQGAYMDNNSSGLTVTYYGIPATTFKEATMNFSVAAANKNSSGFEGIHHTVSSLFSRVQYSYLEKYLFTGVLRRDGSSRFGANNRFGYFPSVAAGWIISREKFFREKNIGFLKIRLSYGKNGSDVLGDFRYVSTIGDGKNYTFGSNEYYLIGHSDNAPSNPDLRWEETQQLNVGFDTRWRNGFSLSLDWFNKTTSGILMPIVFPRYVGVTG
ncbi:MAG: SusC/RagA family TonB-linked outer membrane protein, partial [Niabella sp.]